MKLMIHCPRTGKPVFTGMIVDKVEGSHFSGNRFTCPGCGELHTWEMSDLICPPRSYGEYVSITGCKEINRARLPWYRRLFG
jgi:hypothetical protein